MTATAQENRHKLEDGITVARVVTINLVGGQVVERITQHHT